MRVNSNNVGRRGIVGTEIVVSTALLMLMAVLAVDAALAYYHTSDYYLWRQAAAWAAAGQLQRYQAGAPIDSRPPDGLVPDRITFETVVTPGRDQWQGFNRITVIASATLPTGKRIDERISGYVPQEVTP